MSVNKTFGMIFIHSSPAALCPHVEWGVESVLDKKSIFNWSDQPASTGSFRAELAWHGPQGTGNRLASSLRACRYLRYEVTEDPSTGVDGARWIYTPDLGIFHTMTDTSGNMVVSENRIKYALENSIGDSARLYHELALATGKAWDEELDHYRYATEETPARWLHQIG